MIDRFNFYDVYGYLVPGLTLLVLLWVPFGISAAQLPEGDFASAVAVIALAYVVGHVIQILARHQWPSKTIKRGKLRYWSDILLDDDDKTFAEPIKARIFSLMEEKFRLSARREGKRDEVFQMCRAVLVAGKLATYAEQFQGMYSLMRGLAAAFWIGAAFQLGWAIAALAQANDFVSLVHMGLLGALTLLGLFGLIFALAEFSRWDRQAKELVDQERIALADRARIARIGVAGQYDEEVNEWRKELQDQLDAALADRAEIARLLDRKRPVFQLPLAGLRWLFVLRGQSIALETKIADLNNKLARLMVPNAAVDSPENNHSGRAELRIAETMRDSWIRWPGVSFLPVVFACGGVTAFAKPGVNAGIALVLSLVFSVFLVSLAYFCIQAHDFFAQSAKAIYQYFLVLGEQKTTKPSEAAD